MPNVSNVRLRFHEDCRAGTAYRRYSLALNHLGQNLHSAVGISLVI
jgi:hypothetical protein